MSFHSLLISLIDMLFLMLFTLWLLLSLLGFVRLFNHIIIGEDLSVNIEEMVSPFEVAKLKSHMIKSYHGLGFEIPVCDLSNFLVPR
jgi:hypothetical protein